MSSAEKYRPYYTYQDYLGWEGRWELIDGLPYAMSPSPNTRHQLIVSRAHFIFNLAIKSNKCRKCKVIDFTDWKITDDIVLQPDIILTCLLKHGNFIDTPPDLIVEVLSPSTAMKDRREKFEIYQKQGVKYYIIIDPAFNKIEVFQVNNGIYEVISVNPSAFTFNVSDCTLNVDFADLFEE